MDSLQPFIDLNDLPEPSNQSPINVLPLLVPKLEPKLEPLDEPGLNHHPQEPQEMEQAMFSSNHTTNLNDHNTLPSSTEPDLYSDFYKFSEEFRKMLSQRLNREDSEAVDSSSRAIVAVPDGNQINQQASSADVAVTTPRRAPRVKELVRVNDLRIEDDRNFRDVIRKTRMIYDSLRVLSTVEEDEKKFDLICAKRMRGDLKAASLMRERGLWLYREKRIVGAIPGIYIGDLFFFRMELVVVGLHGQPQAGIDYLPSSNSANGEPIATSVIVSGGYEDDEDSGDVIIYTGHGGQGKNIIRQVVHQKLEGGNRAMERSMHYGIEVRVIRGFKYEGSVSSKIYVYDGLYRIVQCWFDVGKSGFGVYKYKLVRIEGQPEMGSAILKLAQNLRTRPLYVGPMAYLSLDISRQKERIPVRLFNDIDMDKEPLHYEYLPRTNFPPFVFHQTGSATGCDCADGCGDNCFCAMKNGCQFPYTLNGILVRGKPIIFECGPFCRCPPHCRNRVTQHGIKNRMEVFRSRETGWAVRSLDLIHAGTFICEYAGVVLTMEQAKILSMNGDSLIYPSRFANKQGSEWGDLSQIYSNYVRPSYPSIPPLDFAMDVSTMRNVACYISHSSLPNVSVQFVLYDHNNLMFPHLMLFALENIPPMRELSLDYGVADDWTGKLSICN